MRKPKDSDMTACVADDESLMTKEDGKCTFLVVFYLYRSCLDATREGMVL